MDQAALVKSGTQLIRLLDKTPLSPDVAMWVRYPDTDTWKLWISPNKNIKDKREFYRVVAEQITAHRDELSDIEVSSTEFVAPDSPAVTALRKFLHMPEFGTAHLSGNTVNGYYIPEGIAFRVR